MKFIALLCVIVVFALNYPRVSTDSDNAPSKTLTYVLDCGHTLTRKQLQQFKNGIANISKNLSNQVKNSIRYWAFWLVVNGRQFEGRISSTENSTLDMINELDLTTILAGAINEIKITSIDPLYLQFDSGIESAFATNSIMYVFSFKDLPDPVIEHRLEFILDLIDKKKTQIIFAYTGFIELAESYKTIAKFSGGKLFEVGRWQKENWNDVCVSVPIFKFIELSLPFELNKVTLLTSTPKTGTTKHVYLASVPVDSTLQDVIVTCIFNEYDDSFSSLEFRDPTKHNFTNESKVTKLLNTSTAIAMKINDPTPGTWSVILNMEKPRSYTLYVTGRSDFEINIGFSNKSVEQIKSLKDIDPIPLIGASNNIFISVNNPSLYPASFDSCDLLDLNGTTVDSILLNKTSVDNTYYGYLGATEPYFYVRVKGELGGKTFQRVSDIVFRTTKTKPKVQQVNPFDNLAKPAAG